MIEEEKGRAIFRERRENVKRWEELTWDKEG